MFLFLKQKTAYELRISDWSSGVCSSDLRDIITALAVGSEIAIRLGYASRLDGFDPTGACSIFAAAAAAARLLRLDEGRMGHTLALAFNKAGSSFQSNVDASLAVREIGRAWCRERGGKFG